MQRVFRIGLAFLSLVALVATFIPPVTMESMVVGFGLFLLGMVIVWHSALSAAVAPVVARLTKRRTYPSVSVIRPVRGKDVGAEENFTAALDTGYPGEIETLFVFDDEADPGLPVARAVVAKHRALGRPGTAEVIVGGAPPPGRTGKLNAMVVGQRFAHNELVAFGDSDTRPDREVLRGVVDTLLANPNAGSAFAPIVVHKAPRAAGDAMYAIMQNALYAPLAAWASGPTRQLPFIMGQLMVFRRAALRAIGGVETADGQLVDDMYIGKRVHEVGFANVMSRQPLHIATGGMTLRQFLPVFRRWMSFSRNGLPLSFTWRQWLQGGVFFAALLTALVALLSGHALAALVPLAAVVAQTVSLLRLNVENGGAPIPLRWAWAPFAVFILSPVVLAAIAMKRRVEWRGREYNLDAAAALAVKTVARPQLAIVPNESPRAAAGMR